MNQVDALLLVLLVPFALRGWGRGFCRESIGLAGLVGGAFAAAALGEALAAALEARRVLPSLAVRPAAYAFVFVAAVVAANVLGRVVDGLARALFLGGVNRAAGALFGFAKGAAVLGFGLLLAERLVPSPEFTRSVAASRLGQPLVQLATVVLETGRGLASEAQRHA